MAATAASSLQIVIARPSMLSTKRISSFCSTKFGGDTRRLSWNRLASSCHVSSIQHFSRNFTSTTQKLQKVVTKAQSEADDSKPASVLPIDLRGKRAFIAGVADDNGYGWAIAKSLAAAGAEILVGTWVPIKTNKRYAGSSKWTVSEVAESVKEDFGSIDILVHSLANGPEFIRLCNSQNISFEINNGLITGGSSISLTYIASERIIPGYGGGMSSAKAALESDTRVLAFEAGRKQKVRVNTVSAGPLRSRAAKAIGFIDMMIDYSLANAPLQKELSADEVGNTAAFLASPLASAITGAVIYVDNGLNAMGVGVDSPIFKDLNIPKNTE
ncbi:Enoyl-[acyl-carrier-protein] reductase [NADH], chloroplastic [Capsicum annuum]|nr:Enoyl-[acyl-carrier-protein] reductase [NADH], chloroplastic [Capsicum annuum]